MSKQKRGIQYIKNDEPAFLKRMKQQAGYKEPDTVETKRQQLDSHSDDDSDKDDEKPQIVVLSSGDLTAEQAKHAEKEAAVKPREVSDEKVVFKKPKHTKSDDEETKKKSKKSFNSKKIKNSSLLSFNEDEEDG